MAWRYIHAYTQDLDGKAATETCVCVWDPAQVFQQLLQSVVYDHLSKASPVLREKRPIKSSPDGKLQAKRNVQQTADTIMADTTAQTTQEVIETLVAKALKDNGTKSNRNPPKRKGIPTTSQKTRKPVKATVKRASKLATTETRSAKPARGTEIIGNSLSEHTEWRRLIEDGLVCFVTSYHKGYEASEKLKVIQRFLPRGDGELLVYYLWLVRPLWEGVEMMTSRVTEFSPFVWGRPIDEEDEEPTKHPERG
ncbi:hypothetical protein V1527DRAFT_452161 [Lipomyces starkeyi]